MNYRFSIDSLNSQNNIVISVRWSLHGSQGSESASYSGEVPVVFDESKAVIPYSDLKEQDVLDWVKNQLGDEKLNEIKQVISQKILEQKPVFTVTDDKLPWNN
jgi:hypothetical protein